MLRGQKEIINFCNFFYFLPYYYKNQTITSMSELNEETLKLIKDNPKILNLCLKKWIKEYKLDRESNVNWDKLLALFNKITEKNARVIPAKAKGQIRQRLREGYSKRDFKTAMENIMKDNYHQETQYKYVTLEFISRADKLSRLVTQDNTPTKKKPNTFR
jgi:uncharacterized phage protein (TIGR02220 family)